MLRTYLIPTRESAYHANCVFLEPLCQEVGELRRTPLWRTSENSSSETVWKFSGTRQPPHHQADHCRVDERFCASTKPLVILAHPPVLREPGEGPFHHPPAG